jgi:hypothetical protein
MDSIEDAAVITFYYSYYRDNLIILYQPQTRLLCPKVKYKTNLFCSSSALVTD